METIGIVQGNTVILEPGQHSLPDGERVRVEVIDVVTQPDATFADIMSEFCGVIEDMPPDFALNHEHYCNGTPKR
jgi:hypothetical protein